MIIPITKGQATAPGAPAQGMPSETNLMMALATMHEQGRFKVAGDILRFPGGPPPDSDTRQKLQDYIFPQTSVGAGGARPNIIMDKPPRPPLQIVPKE